MRHSVFFKNFIVTICMFAACFVVFGMTMLMMGRAYLIRERQESLYATAYEVTSLAETMSWDSDLMSLEFRMILAVVSECGENHIFLCDDTGVVFTSSDRARVSPYIGRQLSADIMSRLRTKDGCEAMGTLDGFYDEQRYIVAVPFLTEDDGTEGYVFVTCETGDFLAAWNGFVAAFGVVAVCVLGLAICFQYFYSRRVSRPLREMAEAANRFARGDYSARISPYGEADEVGTLADAFNGMAESVERTESRRREFVANVSHELRTPMTTIAGFADGLLDGTIPQSEERKYLEKISSETKRLSRLVRSMLDMSRLRDGDAARRQERFGLGEMVVRTVLNFEERVAEKHLNMALDVPEDELFVRGDMDALTRVVYNLVDNAIKFADEGTELSVSVWKENGRAYTCVQDIGVTIARTELPLIFDRFHKSDRSRSLDRDGVGLGLYMVKEIIAAHEQDIFVTSENGVTAFTFTLALADGEKEEKHHA